MANSYRANLKDCTYESLQKLDKRHVKLSRNDKPDVVERDQHLATMSRILGTIWLRRSADTATSN